MMWLSIAAVPIILLLRSNKPKRNAGPPKSKEEQALERAHAMAE
jgi:hypothetical protein